MSFNSILDLAAKVYFYFCTQGVDPWETRGGVELRHVKAKASNKRLIAPQEATQPGTFVRRQACFFVFVRGSGAGRPQQLLSSYHSRKVAARLVV